MRDSQTHPVTSVFSMNSLKARYFPLVLAFFLLATASLYAQEQLHRNVKKEVKPDYPALARKMGIRGIVKIEVTITPEGKVKSTRVLGGNPVLLITAQQAAMHWEFEAANKVTSQIIEFKFADSQE